MLATRVMGFAAVLWGLHGIPIAMTQASPGCVSSLRFGLSFLILIPVLIIQMIMSGKKPNFGKNTFISAFFWSLNNIFFVFAIAHEGGNVGRTVSLSYCFPIFSILLKWWKTKTLTTTDQCCLLLILSGIYCFVPNLSVAELHSSTFAILSGLALAVHLELTQNSKNSFDIISAIIVGQLLGFLVSLPLTGIEQIAIEVSSFNTQQVIWFIGLGILTGLTYIIYSFAAPALPSTTTSTILLLEIIIALVAGYFILNERLTSMILLGGSLMLGALYIRILEHTDIKSKKYMLHREDKLIKQKLYS